MTDTTGRINQGFVYDMFFRFITQHYKPQRNASKLLAKAAGCSPAAAQAWLSGRRMPKNYGFFRLCAVHDELATEYFSTIDKIRAQNQLSDQRRSIAPCSGGDDAAVVTEIAEAVSICRSEGLQDAEDYAARILRHLHQRNLKVVQNVPA
jgi:hypothetical protein